MKSQKFHLNRIKCLILILLFIIFTPQVQAIVKPTNNFYINDYANILTTETEEYILNKSSMLNKADGTQIVVVTVKNLEGMTLENYANKLFRNFGIGDAKKNNGLLLLLALEERKFRVEVGYGLESILPDGKTGRFQDEYIIPYLKDNKWDEGIKNGYDAFYKEIVTLNNLTIEYAEPINLENNTKDTYPDNFITLVYISIMISGLTGLIIRNKKKKEKKKLIISYLVFLFIILVLVSLFYTYVYAFACLIINLIFFFIGRFKILGYGGGSSRGGFSNRGGFSSRGGFSGRGGSSGGGGSSRGF